LLRCAGNDILSIPPEFRLSLKLFVCLPKLQTSSPILGDVIPAKAGIHNFFGVDSEYFPAGNSGMTYARIAKKIYQSINCWCLKVKTDAATTPVLHKGGGRIIILSIWLPTKL